MPNAQLDRFIHALEAQAVPPLFVAILGAALLVLLFKRLEHTFIRVVRSARAGRQAGKVVTNRNVVSAGVVRHCPICHSQMVKRKARRGSPAGQEFWGCPKFPDCGGTPAFPTPTTGPPFPAAAGGGPSRNQISVVFFTDPPKPDAGGAR